jgi:hypothetical protein
MMKEFLSDYPKWQEVNSDHNFSLFDYIHGVFTIEDLSFDLAIAFLNLCWPDFTMIDDLVFLKEEFSEERYQKLIQGEVCGSEIEYWMNMLCISCLVKCQSISAGNEFASKLTLIWKTKLKIDYPDKEFYFQYFQENSDSEEEGEVYITCSQKIPD